MKTKFSVRDFSLLLSLVAVWAFFAVTSPQYLSARNLSALSVELAITATLALGMLLVILPGHIDLSVGSGVGLVALAIQVITRHTPFGRHLYAIGGNEEAAFVSGVPVQRVVIGAYVLLGGIVAITGLLQTAYAGAATTTVGDSMELDAIAACVIGGTSLRGGRGTVLGVIFGALIMASLLNGMTLLAVSPELKFIARGVVLTLAVWMDVKLARR